VEFLRQKNDLKKGQIAIAGDLRESTDRIMATVAKAIEDQDLTVINCGRIPTPAVTLYGIVKGMPSIMITGSHIPADRNGIKYNLSGREIVKEDEAVISGMEVEIDETLFDENGSLKEAGILPKTETAAEEIYKKRYLDFFPTDMLANKKIGLYGHSAVGREIIEEVLQKLGAEVVRLDFSDSFVPVDTEAVEADLIEKGRNWSRQYGLDAIVTTDGDSDRPLLADENGNWLRADTSGILVAKYLGARTAVIPVSCNTALEKSGVVLKTKRVKVGSPYVVAGMMELMAQGAEKVIGYEANGGFLVGKGFEKDGRKLDQLLTRDALLVLLSVLALAGKGKVSKTVANLPQRFTSSGSVKGFPIDLSLKILSNLGVDKEKISQALGSGWEEIREVNSLDGLRITFVNDRIVHFRPSRNSPEFRNYVEAESEEEARKLSEKANGVLLSWQNKK